VTTTKTKKKKKKKKALPLIRAPPTVATSTVEKAVAKKLLPKDVSRVAFYRE